MEHGGQTANSDFFRLRDKVLIMPVVIKRLADHTKAFIGDGFSKFEKAFRILYGVVSAYPQNSISCLVLIPAADDRWG